MSNKNKSKNYSTSTGAVGSAPPPPSRADDPSPDLIDEVTTAMEDDEIVDRIIGEKIPDSIHCIATGGRCVPVYEITELDDSKRLACKQCAGVGTDRKAIRSL